MDCSHAQHLGGIVPLHALMAPRPRCPVCRTTEIRVGICPACVLGVVASCAKLVKDYQGTPGARGTAGRHRRPTHAELAAEANAQGRLLEALEP